MRNKILILALAMFLVLALVGCKFITPPTPDPVEPAEVLSADVIVIHWIESEKYPEDSIDIEYLITNTGTVDIDFSKILFEVTYEELDRDIYTFWIDGVGVDVDCYKRVYVKDVWVGDREVADVVAIDWELASY